MNAKTQVIGKYINLEQARLNQLAGELNSLFVLFFPLLKGYSHQTGLLLTPLQSELKPLLVLYAIPNNTSLLTYLWNGMATIPATLLDTRLGAERMEDS